MMRAVAHTQAPRELPRKRTLFDGAALLVGVVEPADRVLCLMSGTGLKDPGVASRLVSPVATIPLDRHAVAGRVNAQDAGSRGAQRVTPLKEVSR